MPSSSSPRPPLASRFGAAIYDPFLARGERRGMARRRSALLADATGAVLEIGAGTGLNLPYYRHDAVDELVLTEPDPGMHARLVERVSRSGIDAAVVQATAEDLPFEDARFDRVVSTMVLCTVADPAATLAELRRVLRPSGRLLFVEHVRSETPRLARRQDRFVRPWAAFGAGCRCNQPTLELLREAGLRVERVRRDEWRGMPSIVRPLAVGHAQVG